MYLVYKALIIGDTEVFRKLVNILPPVLLTMPTGDAFKPYHRIVEMFVDGIHWH